MDWKETQELLNKIAESTIRDFKKHVSIHGAYPDNIADYPERQAEEDAYYYLSMKRFPLDHPDIDLDDDEMEESFGLDSKAAKDIRWRRDGGKLSLIESITAFANKIISEKKLTIPLEDQELFCQKVAEMLWQTKINRESVIDQFLYPISFEHENETTPHPIVKDQITYDVSEPVIMKTKMINLFDDHIIRKLNLDDNIDQNWETNYRKKFSVTYDIWFIRLKRTSFHEGHRFSI